MPIPRRVARRTARRTSRRMSRRQQAMSAAAAPPPQQGAAPEPQPEMQVPVDPYEELKKLGQLHQQGVLTDEEFAAAKARILG